MEQITKNVLEYLGNTHTKIERKEGFMGNYYSHLIDTIYIAEAFETKEVPGAVKSINKKAAELITVCHECIHSIQNKYVHLVNTIFSNLSLVLAIVCVAWGLFWTSPVWLRIIAGVVIVASIIVRLVLEIGAVNGSIKLAAEIVDKGIIDSTSEQDIEKSIKYINKYKVVALLQMVSDKIIFLILTLVIN